MNYQPVPVAQPEALPAASFTRAFNPQTGGVNDTVSLNFGSMEAEVTNVATFETDTGAKYSVTACKYLDPDRVGTDLTGNVLNGTNSMPFRVNWNNTPTPLTTSTTQPYPAQWGGGPTNGATYLGSTPSFNPAYFQNPPATPYSPFGQRQTPFAQPNSGATNWTNTAGVPYSPYNPGQMPNPSQAGADTDFFAGPDLSADQEQVWTQVASSMTDEEAKATAFYAAKIVESGHANPSVPLFESKNFATSVADAALNMAIRDVRNVTDGQSFSMSLGQTHGFGWGGENFDSKIEEWKSERRNRNGRFLSYLGFGPQVTEFEKHLASNNAKDIAVTLEAFKKLKRDYGVPDPSEASSLAVDLSKHYSSWRSDAQQRLGSFPYSGSGGLSLPSFDTWSDQQHSAFRDAQTASNTAANGSGGYSFR